MTMIERVPAAVVKTVTYVEVESDPGEPVYGDPEYPGITGYTLDTDHAALPVRFAAVLAEIINHADGHSCDVCDAGIGWVLVEDDMLPSGGGMTWRYLSLVDLGEQSSGVAKVCEDCSPATLYYHTPEGS